MPITPELLDELLKDYNKPDDLLGEDGLLYQLTKALVERALNGELTHHLGYQKHDSIRDNTRNSLLFEGRYGWVASEIHLHRIQIRLIEESKYRLLNKDEESKKTVSLSLVMRSHPFLH